MDLQPFIDPADAGSSPEPPEPPALARSIRSLTSPRATPPVTAAGPGPAPALIAARTLAQRTRLPRGRLSSDKPTTFGLDDYYNVDPLAGYPGDDRERITRVIRYLAQRDEDMQGSLREFVILANPGHTLEIDGSQRAITTAKRNIDDLLARLNPTGGGLDGFLNNQIAEIFMTGATSAEWYPLEDLSGVAGVAVVQAETVRITRRDDQAFRYWQLTPGDARGTIELHPATFHYSAIQTDGASPYGVPMPIASLAPLDRKVRLAENIDRVVNLMKMIALVTANVPAPTPEELGLETDLDPLYETALTTYYDELASLVVSGSEQGFFLGPVGMEIQATPVRQNIDGLDRLQLMNQRQVWSSVLSLGFMRGHMDSTTEALAKVVYPILEAQAENMQLILAKQVEFGLNLHLRLCGTPARARIRFDQARSAFALDEAETHLTRARADEILLRMFGDDWLVHAGRQWGVKLGADRAGLPDNYRRSNTSGDPSPNPNPGDQTDAGSDDPDAEPSTTDAAATDWLEDLLEDTA